VRTPPVSPRIAIGMYLQEWDGASPRVSVLEGSLRDARATMEHGTAPWLAALGYLVVLEQVGANLARPDTRFRFRTSKELRFRAGALEFAPNPKDERLASALYALRCGLAHESGLQARRLVFVLTRDGPLITYPRTPWDGSREALMTQPVMTVVNVRAVGRYVEAVVAEARNEFAQGRVELAPNVIAENLLVFGGFITG